MPSAPSEERLSTLREKLAALRSRFALLRRQTKDAVLRAARRRDDRKIKDIRDSLK